MNQNHIEKDQDNIENNNLENLKIDEIFTLKNSSRQVKMTLSYYRWQERMSRQQNVESKF